VIARRRSALPPAVPLPTALLPAVLLAAGILAGCTASPPPALTVPSYAYPVAPETTFDLARGEALTPAQAARALAAARLVFVGEHHTEPRSHAFQREVLERLAETGRPLVVALEYLPPEADAALEDWRQGRLDELTFLERSDWYAHWGFAWAHYRDLFALFRARRLPLRGVNATRAVREAVRAGQAEALPDEVRALLGDLDAVVPPHEAYLLETLRDTGHADALAQDSSQFQRYRRVQRMWDRLLGVRTARLAEALGADGTAVLLVGSGHLAFGLGANLQAARESALSRLSVWDTLVSSAELDAQGRYPVPIGMADWVRVYVRPADPAAAPPDYPSLGTLRLEDPDGAEPVAERTAEAKAAEPAEAKAAEPPAEAPTPEQPAAPKRAAPPAPRGVRVRAVLPFAPAELRALQADDVVLALNGAAPRSATALRLAYEQLPFGQPARFRVWRAGQELDVEVTPRAPGAG
jgi:uncharacterized iron-regulated protein